MLNFKKPDPPPPELIVRCREMLQSTPDDIESVVRMLRDLGYSKGKSMLVLKEVLGLGTGQLKELLHFSHAWADHGARDDEFHEQLWKLAKKLAEEDESISIKEESDSETD
jgi:hypothetical protein